MKNEVLIALLAKSVDQKLSELPASSRRTTRGPRGFVGEPGKDFEFEEYSDQIKGWIKDLSLKFSDLTSEEIQSLKGPPGERGQRGLDGKSFIFSDHEEKIVELIKSQVDQMSEEFKLKFSDLTAEEIEKLKGSEGPAGKSFDYEEHKSSIANVISVEFNKNISNLKLKFEDLNSDDISQIRGPRGNDGRDGRPGKDFEFEENRSGIAVVLQEMAETLRLKYADLSPDQIEELRGPRGHDGRDGRHGKDFEFEEHREFFESLKLKFADLSADDIEQLKLRFSHLSIEEREQLKLKFADLSEEEKLDIRGVRGQRGKRGAQGPQGEKGEKGDTIVGPRGLPGPRGIPGLPGVRGIPGLSGQDGQDAPYVTNISIDISEDKQKFSFVFFFSDDSRIETERIELPKSIIETMYVASGVGRSSVSKQYETRIDEVDAATTYVGEAPVGTDTDVAVWRIKRILVVGTETSIEWADSDSKFDNIWDNRESLLYG